MSSTVHTERDGPVLLVAIDRTHARNAVDRPTADALEAAFREGDADDGISVAVLAGEGDTFCAGADLEAIATGSHDVNRVERGEHGPMGPTRLLLDLPVIAAVEGHAVAGGLELALWCDLRVAARDAVLGVFCRRWGVPLIDGGTARLPRLVGLSHALDLILTGRPVSGEEALTMGLVNRLVEPGTARASALELAHQLAGFPQACLRADRRSAHVGLDLGLEDALLAEHDRGVASMQSGEMLEGVSRFHAGAGRHGRVE